MSKKIVLITGSTDGIGFQTALELANKGHKIILHGRNEEKAAAALTELSNLIKNPDLDFVYGDLASLHEVFELSERIKSKFPKLDVLINNAGIYANDFRLSVDGYELTFAVNHLAHFLLTLNLLPLLKKSGTARIINVSSVAHKRGRIDFNNLKGENDFNAYATYAQSKLANVLFSNLLAEKLNGTNVTSNSLHPGVITTKLLKSGFSMSGASLKDGAVTSVYLAVAEEVQNISGKYFDNKTEAPCSSLARDKSLQEELWDFSINAVNKFQSESWK
jgi:NAD(P)-dependent dehydrogenase (short-subunit alcohol dehydrogenase family)